VRAELAAIWIYFADTSCRGYSPLYDDISRAVAQSDAVLALVQEAPPEGHLPTVLLAAVHYLLLGGEDSPLAAVYAGTSNAPVGPRFVEFCLDHRAEIVELLATRRTNTNEVGRSAVLAPAIAHATRDGSAIGLVDVGCSAGLNLYCDRYFVDYGRAGSTGPKDAAVRLSCEVVDGRPPIVPQLPAVLTRVGIDRHPVDVGNDDARRWQLACVWPDTGRLARTRHALDVLQHAPPRVLAGDAVDTVGDAIDLLPADALAVVITTWMLAYLSPERRVAFRDALADASRRRPITWISGESAGVVDQFADASVPAHEDGIEPSVLGLVTFRDGGIDCAELLAFVHPHGSWIDWRARA